MMEPRSTTLPLDFITFEKQVMHRNLSKFHLEDIKKLWGNRFVFYILPRGHLKTTLYSIDYPIYNLWKMPGGFKMALTSSSLEKQSWKIMEEVQTQIETNPMLSWLVPKKSESIWNKSQVTTTNGNTYSVLPLNDSIRGNHVDVYICDDILRDEDVTQDEVKKLFWNLIFPTVNTRKGQIVFVGTRMTTDDIFAEIMNIANAKPGDELYETKEICIKANLLPIGSSRQVVITDPQDSNIWLEPLWKERFTLDEIRAFQAFNRLAFDREYMNNPRAGGGSIFTEEMLSKRHTQEIHGPVDGWEFYLGHDIALSEDKAADFTVFDVVGMDKYRNLKEWKIERYKGMSMNEQLKRAETLHQIFCFRGYMIEDRGLSQGLVKDVMASEILRPIAIPFRTERTNKELLISRIATTLSSGALTLLDKEVRINELRNFGIKKDKHGKETYEAMGGHDDTVIALGLALEAALGRVGGTASISFLDDVEDLKRAIGKVGHECPRCGLDMEPRKNPKEWYCRECNTEWCL